VYKINIILYDNNSLKKISSIFYIYNLIFYV